MTGTGTGSYEEALMSPIGGVEDCQSFGEEQSPAKRRALNHPRYEWRRIACQERSLDSASITGTAISGQLLILFSP